MTNPNDIELLQPGETILNDQYTIEKHLGSGGQGQVYLARHRIFGQVAVKRLHPHIAAQPKGLARFERESRITDELRGEHVIFIRNFERDPARDEWFSIMEYANGRSLEDKLATEAPLSVTEAIQLTIALCQALAPIHEYPYAHGDLKPSNILFHTKPHEGFILKLSDFGSAFQPIRAGVLPLPSGLKEARTHMYVSPELLDASDPEDIDTLEVGVDQRADIYSIGVILYEMLAGRPPFWEPSGESEDVMVLLEQRHALFQKTKHQVPPEPKKKRPEILPSLNAMVMKALAKNPADRFANVDEMQVSLEVILQEEGARLAELNHLRPLADQAFEAKQWGQASDFLYKILDLAPDDPDALQKLKIAQDQQQLMDLRHQIPRKMNEGSWQEVKDLIEKALTIAPGDATLTAWLAKTDEQLTIIGMLEEAKKFEKKAEWREVINLCLEALRLDPSHVEASNLLSRAQTRYRIATLRQEIEALHREGDKQEELEKLTELQELIPTDNEINTRIKNLRETIELETYYVQGKQAYYDGRWEEVIAAMERVLDIDAFYDQDGHSAAALKADAEKKLAQQEAEAVVTLSAENSQRQSERELLSNFKRLLSAIDIIAVPKKIWSLITHNKTLAIITLVVTALAIPAVGSWVSGWFGPPSIDEFKIFLDGYQIAGDSITAGPIALTQLPTLTGGEPVRLEVVMMDVDRMKTYKGYDIKCKWIVTPIYDEIEDIKTEACETLYIPSQNVSRQKLIVEVEGVEQRFRPIPRISMEFEIANK